MKSTQAEQQDRRTCEICKQEFAASDGKERADYHWSAALSGVPGKPRNVFVCHACAGSISPAFRVFLWILGIFLAICAGLGIFGAMVAPNRKK